MDEREIRHRLIEILSAVVNEREAEESIRRKLTSETLRSVYLLAKEQDLAHVVSEFVYRNHIEVDRELQTYLQQEEMLSVYRNEQMKYAEREIRGALEESKIAYIPLKGSVLRPYYPYERMRTSCDIDILIHEYDIDAAVKCLENRGYRCDKRNYHDVSLYSPNRIHLELHFHLRENVTALDAVLKDAWEHAVPCAGAQYAFSREFFAFHLFAHMAYHFMSGGCGIRSLLDIWVMDRKMGISDSCAKELLQKAGIDRFASEMSKLAECCFTDGEINGIDDLSDSVLKYLFQGGIYGSRENQITVDRAKTGNSVLYVLKRLFLPYRSMAIAYPVLKKAPYLLPIFWGVRWIRAVFGGRSKHVIAELACVDQMPNETIEEMQKIRSQLGI